jgi:hypothetical protein
MALSAPSFKLSDDLCAEHKADQALWATVSTSDRGKEWGIDDDLITVCSRPVVASASPLLPTILAHAHGARQEGIEKTLHRLHADFHTSGERGVVRGFVRACEVCQSNKSEQFRPTGLLQPLEVPSAIWVDIAMDFIEGFPRINGKSVILTIVDVQVRTFHPIGPPLQGNAGGTGLLRQHRASSRHPEFNCE